jgi:protein O-GlcNAc transferase
MTPLLQQALALHRSGRIAEAESLYAQLLAEQPDNFVALQYLGVLRFQQRRYDEALAKIDAALAVKSDAPDAHANRALVLRALGRLPEALVALDRALTLAPDYLAALFQRGVTLLDLERFAEALASLDKADAIRPRHRETLHARAMALAALGRHKQALGALDSLLALDPDNVEGLRLKGQTLLRLRRLEEALVPLDRAIALAPHFAPTLATRAVILAQLHRMEAAAASAEAALAQDPDLANAVNALAQIAQALCDWRRTARIGPDLIARASQPQPMVAPFVLVGYSDDPGLLRHAAEHYVAQKLPQPVARFAPRPARDDGRLRIAYMSQDFRDHATANLMAGLFEHHDRSRFEIIGLSLGRDDGSAIRKRLVAAFAQFHELAHVPDAEIAALIHRLDVDIAVDLNVHTQSPRPGILAGRPAPIQVNYLGYPGTSGADFIDYILADAVVAPFAEGRFYSERIVHLPHSYQVTDDRRQMDATPGRSAAGLPSAGFVFCSFNHSWKINAALFDIWMRLLKAVDGSVLWLIAGERDAEANLRREARARGVDDTRLIFAPRVPQSAHLARQGLADLFLDTLPYNAHTTASDALWAGLPLVTCAGPSFAGRVAASVLTAMGMRELITTSLEEYEALALALARDPARLAALKQKLARQRRTSALFDTAGFTHHIETAFEIMWTRHKAGEGPGAFAVPL